MKIFFWSNWQTSYKYFYLFSLLTLFVAIAYYLWSYSLGLENTINWQIEGELETVKMTISTFEKYLFGFSADADSYLLVEKFKPTNLKINYLAYKICLGFLVFGILLILTAISDLSRNWYAAGMAVVILLVANMKLELLGILNQFGDKTLFVVLFLSFASVSFFFQSFYKRTHYLLRFSIYLAMIIGFAYLINTQSRVTQIPMVLLNNGIAWTMVLTLLFCGFNAHEFIRAFIYVTTVNNNQSAKGTFRHFMILCAIYMANLVYSYMYIVKGFRLDIFFIHPMVIFAITTVLGVWGLKVREVHYERFMQFAPTGAFLYLGVALVSVASITLAHATGNSSLIESYEDGFIFAQLGFGVMIFFYVITNFIRQIEKNQKVYKVFYKGKDFVFSFAWFLGFLVMVIFFFFSGKIPYKQAFSGYYNGLADLSYAQGDIYESKQYYSLSLEYSRTNTHAHYALGTLAEENDSKVAAFVFYNDANRKEVNPYAYAKVSDYYLEKKQIFKAIQVLEQAVKKAPKNGELHNNLALLYNKVAAPDSALIYFEYGKQYTKFPEVLESNTFSIWTKYNIFQNLDSIYSDEVQKSYVGTANNELVFLNSTAQKSAKNLNMDFLKDSILATANMCYLYNYAFNPAAITDTTLGSVLQRFQNVPQNISFATYLKFARANLYYKQGKVFDAIKLLKELFREGSSANPYYANLLGTWLLEQNAFEASAYYSNLAYLRGQKSAVFKLAVAQSEFVEDKNLLRESWQKVAEIAYKDWQNSASEMLEIFKEENIAASDFDKNTSDLLKYKYLHYNKNISDKTFDLLMTEIKRSEIQLVTMIERLDYFIKKKDKKQVEICFTKVKNKVTDQNNIAFQQAELQYLDFIKKYDIAFFEKVKSANFSYQQQGLKSLYLAKYFSENKINDKAILHFDEALQSMPFNEVVYLSYADFYKSVEQKEKAYEIILTGTEVNEQSTLLMEAYILMCLDVYYFSYADYAIIALEKIASETAFADFKEKYKIAKLKAETSFSEEL